MAQRIEISLRKHARILPRVTANEITEFTIDCVKGREDFVGTLEDAIRRADEMDREWQPAYGVEVWWGDELQYTTGDFA